MKNLIEGIRPVMLMGPGPSCVHPSVYHALSRPTLGHLDKYFITIMDDIKEMLRTVMSTKNNMTLPMSGTGSSGMETAFVNTIEKGDRVLIIVNGVFSTRMVDVAERLGAQVDRIDFDWGKPIIIETVKEKLKDKKYDIVGIVHAETSTGVVNPVAEISKLLGGQSIYIVDCVTSLGGMPVNVDEWGADVCYSGTQKCLSVPPGLAPITFSDKAVDKIMSRETKVPNWYLDISLLASYWDGNTRVYHHTAPINMLYGLYQALHLLLEEGLENSFARHQKCHLLLVDGLKKLGLEMFVDEPYRLPMLNLVSVPEGVDEAALRARLINEFDIEIGAGLGALAGKVIRIGIMGHTANEENIDRLLKALAVCLGK
jgi:alanine-glyoxylate transaminase/serine-glyoxylate transaminase/serine-pyruvate transaminase